MDIKNLGNCFFNQRITGDKKHSFIMYTKQSGKRKQFICVNLGGEYYPDSKPENFGTFF